MEALEGPEDVKLLVLRWESKISLRSFALQEAPREMLEVQPAAVTHGSILVCKAQALEYSACGLSIDDVARSTQHSFFAGTARCFTRQLGSEEHHWPGTNSKQSAAPLVPLSAADTKLELCVSFAESLLPLSKKPVKAGPQYVSPDAAA